MYHISGSMFVDCMQMNMLMIKLYIIYYASHTMPRHSNTVRISETNHSNNVLAARNFESIDRVRHILYTYTDLFI